jgi:hypothetical protein
MPYHLITPEAVRSLLDSDPLPARGRRPGEAAA